MYVLHHVFPCIAAGFLRIRTFILFFLNILHTHPERKLIFVQPCGAFKGRKLFLKAKMHITHVTMKNGFKQYENNFFKPVYAQGVENFRSLFLMEIQIVISLKLYHVICSITQCLKATLFPFHFYGQMCLLPICYMPGISAPWYPELGFENQPMG